MQVSKKIRAPLRESELHKYRTLILCASLVLVFGVGGA